MKKLSISLCILLALVAFQVVQYSANTSEPSQTSIQPNALTSHAPLTIGSVDQIENIYGFPGAGTANSPYIISGLLIESTTAPALIEIRALSVHILITGNFLNASGLTYHGIILWDASNVQIIDNEIYARETATSFTAPAVSIQGDSYNNRIVGNQIQDSDYGVYIQTLADSTTGPRNNTVYNNQFNNIFIIGVMVDSIVSGLVISNNSIIGNTFTDTGTGIKINAKFTTSGVSDHIIRDNIFQDGESAIYLVALGDDHLYPNLNRYISVINNTILRPLYQGIVIVKHSFNSIVNNSIQFAGEAGLYLASTVNNTISGNTIFKNDNDGIYVTASTISPNRYNNFSGNIVANNSLNGIHLAYKSKNNRVINNTVANNTLYGIKFWDTDKSHYISRNDFIDNNGGLTQANGRTLNTVEYNYWNDWTTPDVNNDGIVDSPYVINSGDGLVDPFPLTEINNVAKIIHSLTGLELTTPNGGENLVGTIQISWNPAADTEGHPISYSVSYSSDNGVNWNLLQSDLLTTTLNWDTTILSNGSSYLIKINADDSIGLLLEDVSDSVFSISNPVPVSNTPTDSNSNTMTTSSSSDTNMITSTTSTQSSTTENTGTPTSTTSETPSTSNTISSTSETQDQPILQIFGAMIVIGGMVVLRRKR